MTNHSGIVDSGTHFQIVPSTRKVTVPPAYKVIGTVGEHFAEQLTFKCPKLIDGHDIANCARKYITWKNINGDVGNDELKNMTEDEEDLYFTWDVSNGLTVAKGLVSFSVHFEDTDANDRTLYRWSTTTCSECEILDTINAVLNAYEAVYVADDTLVFADYNVVKENTLTLDTDGVIPEGTIDINENGTHDVGKYAMAKVSVNEPSGTMTIIQNGIYNVKHYAQVDVKLPVEAPQISVTDNGVIRASANGVSSEAQLNSTADPDFVAENIKNGVNIFGVTGTYGSNMNITATYMVNVLSSELYVKYSYFDDATSLVVFCEEILAPQESFAPKILKNSVIQVETKSYAKFTVTETTSTPRNLGGSDYLKTFLIDKPFSLSIIPKL